MLTTLLDTADRRTRLVYRCATVLVKGVLLFGITYTIRYRYQIGIGVEWRAVTLEESLKSAYCKTPSSRCSINWFPF
jgi:hypothetical protein